MQVKDNKAYATLTDVKNKTGDVFALADEHGEVTITSYNKDKYLIKRLLVSRVSPSIEEVTEPSVPPLPKTPVAPEPKPIEIMSSSGYVSKLQTSDRGIIGIFSGISQTELWDRNNKGEQSWVKDARKLL